MTTGESLSQSNANKQFTGCKLLLMNYYVKH